MSDSSTRNNADAKTCAVARRASAIPRTRGSNDDDIHVSWRRSTSPAFLWFQTRESLDNGSLRCLSEALVLLQQFSRADWSGFVAETSSIWSTGSSRWLQELHMSARRSGSRFGIAIAISDVSDLAALDPTLLLSHPADVHNSDFHSVFSSLQSSTEGLKVLVRLTIISRNESDRQIPASLLETVREFVRQAKAQQDGIRDGDLASSSRSVSVVIHGVNISCVRNQSVCVEGLDHLASIVKSGTAVGAIPQIDVRADPVACIEPLHVLLSTYPLDGNESKGIEYAVHHSVVPPDTSPAVLSALLETTSVENLTMNGQPDDLDPMHRTRWWQWIGTILFVKPTKHQIKRITMDLSSVDTTAIRELLAHPDPLQLVFGVLSQSEAPASTPQRLTALRFWLDHPSGDAAGKRRQFSSASPLQVAIMSQPHEDNDEYEVVLPGLGLASVDRQDALTFHSRQAESSPRASVLRSLEITAMTTDARDAVAQFVGWFGSGLKKLQVSQKTGDVLMDDWCLRVLTSCPNIKWLECGNGVRFTTLQPFIDASNAGACQQLQFLKLQNVVVTEFAACESFLEALSTPTNPLAHSLLKVEIALKLDVTLGLQLVASVEELLAQNRGLRFLTIQVEMLTRRDQRHVYGQASGMMSDLSTIAAIEKSFPLANRLAFLSVACTEESASSGLDVDAILLIWKFAASRFIRRCQFETTMTLDSEE